MGSKRKPNSHLKSQTKKNKIQNSQNFTLETIFDRFPNLSDDILKYLDEKSLANCVEVNRKWHTTIANQRVYIIAKIQTWSRYSKQFSKEWSMAFVKTPLEFLRRLANYILEYQYFECEYKPSSLESDSLCCKCLINAPLHVAALHGDIELFKHIAVKTNNKSPKNCLGKTPLHLAAFKGHLQICKWYIKYTEEVNIRDDNGCTPLHDAAHGGQLETFKYLLDNGANSYFCANEYGVVTTLHFAAKGGSYEICRLLVSKGMAVDDSCDAFGNTLLHLAAFGSYEICKMFVEVFEGLDVNTKDIDGKTPIHVAVEENKLETVRLLFKEGGDLDSRTNEGDTPLHAAARYGHTEVVKFILSNVVDKNPVNDNGDTPLRETTKNGFIELRKLFFNKGKINI